MGKGGLIKEYKYFPSYYSNCRIKIWLMNSRKGTFNTNFFRLFSNFVVLEQLHSWEPTVCLANPLPMRMEEAKLPQDRFR